MRVQPPPAKTATLAETPPVATASVRATFIHFEGDADLVASVLAAFTGGGQR